MNSYGDSPKIFLKENKNNKYEGLKTVYRHISSIKDFAL